MCIYICSSRWCILQNGWTDRGAVWLGLAQNHVLDVQSCSQYSTSQVPVQLPSTGIQVRVLESHVPALEIYVMFLLKTAKVEVWRRVCQWYGPTNHHKLWSKTLPIKHIDLEDFFAKICQELARTNSAIFVSTGTPVPKSRVSSTSTSTSTWKRYLSTAQVPVQVSSTTTL